MKIQLLTYKNEATPMILKNTDVKSSEFLCGSLISWTFKAFPLYLGIELRNFKALYKITSRLHVICIQQIHILLQNNLANVLASVAQLVGVLCHAPHRAHTTQIVGLTPSQGCIREAMDQCFPLSLFFPLSLESIENISSFEE